MSFSTSPSPPQGGNLLLPASSNAVAIWQMSDAHSALSFPLLAVFPGMPAAPGMQCQGEDRSIYRRGARRWRKLYKVNGHIFQAKRFNRVSEWTDAR